ncbi:GPO family capsid scaffolding protein [Escherichia coli]|uniref:GPO family capsid scaffolding protein n=1 Tax=Escherichia coli TaxID=562 RepID=UPI00135E26E7|nr:GPO family capsid scaffolding protein [Escherichia coli]MXF04498.1 GPO family capsid scaffolding protein [Escherichia coli]
MARKSTAWHRIAVEGGTTDGRAIQREWLTGAADAYNPEVYGARINCEHIRSRTPMIDPKVMPFGAYGDVTALKAEEITEGPLKGRMALYAQLAPTEDLIALNRRAQKVYCSAELAPQFAETGTPYLLGLAITDSPASLGTAYLQFCAQNPQASPLAARHTTPGAVFTAAEEFTLLQDMQAFTDDTGGDATSFFSRITALLFSTDRRQSQHTTELRDAVELLANSQRDVLNELDQMKQTLNQAVSLSRQVQQLTRQHDNLVVQLTTQPAPHTPRPAATGSSADSVDDLVDY